MLAKHIQQKAKEVDFYVSKRIYDLSKKTLPRKYLKFLEYSCHGIPWLALVAICFYTSDTSSRWYARLLIGLIFDIIYVAVLKSVARRARPSYAYQEDQMVMIGVDKMSLPSGHTSRAVYIALVLSHYWYAPVVWLWALSVIGSRVAYGRHFVGDVLAGSLLGYWNFLTQTTLLYPAHAFAMWFLMSMVRESSTDDF